MAKKMQNVASSNRPLGITIIAIIGIILALLGILGSVGMIGIGGLADAAGAEIAALAGVFLGIGAAMLIVSIIELLGFVWLLKMKRKGWLIVTILGIISIIISIASMVMSGAITGVVEVVVWLIIIGYLYTKRALFV